MHRQLPRALWIITAIAGGGISVGSVVSAGLIFVLPLLAGNALATSLMGVCLAGVLLGLGLLWAGWSGAQQLPAPKVYARWGWAICLLWLLVVVVIAVLVPVEWHQRPIFAPLHLGLAALPAFLLLSLMTLTAGRYRALTLRELIAAMSGGASGVVIALPIEVIGFVLSVMLVVLVTMLVPGGAAEIARMTATLEQWTTMPPTHIEQIIETIASPVVFGVLFLMFVVIAPLVEEFGKTLVLGLLGVWRRPGLTQAFIWGAACGLGFGIIESITNGAAGLGEVTGWLGGMGARALAAAMHMLTSGIVGLGWGFFWRKRRWVLPLAYLVAILFHGLWNLNAVMSIGGAAIGTATSPFGFIIAAIGMGLMIILALFAPLALLGIPVLLRAHESQSA